MPNEPRDSRDHARGHEHGEGLHEDLRVMRALHERRQVLRFLAGASLVPLFGCSSGSGILGDADGGGSDAGASSDTASGTDATTPSTCSSIPEETGGPYPGDGTNGPNALTSSGIVRSDIRSSFGSMSGTAAGIPLTIELTLVNTNGACAALGGYAIYLWHCDRDGKYSLYTVSDQNYLRGVQETDANGKVTFTSIFPACYSGRWPHIHFEIFESLGAATSGTSKVKTTQLAMPKASCDVVYATSGYEQSVSNLAQTSLTTDMVFSDGAANQVPSITGDTTSGYTISLTVGVGV